MKKRCKWAQRNQICHIMIKNGEGPQHDDQKLFEFLVLEGAQAGLSWTTILKP